jgi:hypothetical protein
LPYLVDIPPVKHILALVDYTLHILGENIMEVTLFGKQINDLNTVISNYAETTKLLKQEIKQMTNYEKKLQKAMDLISELIINLPEQTSLIKEKINSVFKDQPLPEPETSNKTENDNQDDWPVLDDDSEELLTDDFLPDDIIISDNEQKENNQEIIAELIESAINIIPADHARYELTELIPGRFYEVDSDFSAAPVYPALEIKNAPVVEFLGLKDDNKYHFTNERGDLTWQDVQRIYRKPRLVIWQPEVSILGEFDSKSIELITSRITDKPYQIIIKYPNIYKERYQWQLIGERLKNSGICGDYKISKHESIKDMYNISFIGIADHIDDFIFHLYRVSDIQETIEETKAIATTPEVITETEPKPKKTRKPREKKGDFKVISSTGYLVDKNHPIQGKQLSIVS